MEFRPEHISDESLDYEINSSLSLSMDSASMNQIMSDDVPISLRHDSAGEESIPTGTEY